MSNVSCCNLCNIGMGPQGFKVCSSPGKSCQMQRVSKSWAFIDAMAWQAGSNSLNLQLQADAAVLFHGEGGNKLSLIKQWESCMGWCMMKMPLCHA